VFRVASLLETDKEQLFATSADPTQLRRHGNVAPDIYRKYEAVATNTDSNEHEMDPPPTSSTNPPAAFGVLFLTGCLLVKRGLISQRGKLQ